MQKQNPRQVLRRFFAGITEHAFQTQLGIADPPLIDYLTDMLVRFVRCESIYRLRDLSGRPLHEVAEMLIEAEARVGDARREIHRHIGDFVLFWAGVYPETLCRLRGTDTKDFFIDYRVQGKRAYYIASQIETEREESAPSEVLERLSDQFEVCLHGLSEARREWERRDGGGDTLPLLIN